MTTTEDRPTDVAGLAEVRAASGPAELSGGIELPARLAGPAPARPPIWKRLSPKVRKTYGAAVERWERDKLAELPEHEFDESFQITPTDRYQVFNRTPYLIQIKHPISRFGEIRLPPYVERIIKGGRIRPFDEEIRGHRQRHEILVRKYGEGLTNTNRLVWPIWLALAVAVGVVIYDVFVEGTLNRPELYVSAGLVTGVIILTLLVGAVREIQRRRDANEKATEAGDVAHGLGGSYTNGNETARATHHMLTLLLVIFIGAVVPAIAIIVATDTRTFLDFDGGLRIDPAEGGESRLVGRLIQITYTIVLSLFPALLFFQFDRQRAGSLRAGWVRDLFRMDRRLRTLADVHAIYGDGMYDVSGNSEDSVRLLGGKHSPIVVATILIMLGWTVLVIRTDSYDFRGATEAALQVEVASDAASAADNAANDAAEAALDGDAVAAQEAASVAAAAENASQAAEEAIAEVSPADDEGETPATVLPPSEAPVATVPAGTDEGTAAEVLADQARVLAEMAQASADGAEVEEAQITSKPFYQLLSPSPSAAGMAFLGAYFFGVYLLLRGYFRGDLRPKVYNQITARLVTVVVVAYLINALLVDASQQGVIWALAFLAGVVPSTVVAALLKSVNGVIRRMVPETLNPPRPLEHIDGIDIYDASRLETEGIPDVAALANSDLSMLMFNTRLPIGRLVDWADQAVMMVVVSPGGTPSTRQLDQSDLTGSALPDSKSNSSQKRATRWDQKRARKADRIARRGIDPRIVRLRDRGIRTGTDVLDAVEGRYKKSSREVVKAILGDVHDDADEPSNTADRPGEHHRDDDLEDLPDADMTALCRSIRRQPVMAQILAWRSSPLADVGRQWIELPSPGAELPPNRSYLGPLPDAPVAPAAPAT